MGIGFLAVLGCARVNRVTELTISQELDWYVVSAYSGYEKNVARVLEERVQVSGMKDSFGAILVPSEEVVEMRGGTKRRSERKFFPGYVLIQMEMNEATWQLVNSTPSRHRVYRWYQRETGSIESSGSKSDLGEGATGFGIGNAKDGL